MAGSTPPKIEDSPKSFIGVGSRELGICAAGLVGAVLIYTSGLSTPIKIGLAILVAGAAIGLAFGRDPKTGRKLESMAFEFLKFHGRDKFHRKGADHEEIHEYPKEEKPKPVKKPKKESKPLFEVQPIPLGFAFFFQVCSIAFLAVLVTYIWGGGLQNELFRYKVNHFGN